MSTEIFIVYLLARVAPTELLTCTVLSLPYCNPQFYSSYNIGICVCDPVSTKTRSELVSARSYRPRYPLPRSCRTQVLAASQPRAITLSDPMADHPELETSCMVLTHLHRRLSGVLCNPARSNVQYHNAPALCRRMSHFVGSPGQAGCKYRRHYRWSMDTRKPQSTGFVESACYDGHTTRGQWPLRSAILSSREHPIGSRPLTVPSI